MAYPFEKKGKVKKGDYRPGVFRPKPKVTFLKQIKKSENEEAHPNANEDGEVLSGEV